jgi:Flp pilus assembly protein TadD
LCQEGLDPAFRRSIVSCFADAGCEEGVAARPNRNFETAANELSEIAQSKPGSSGTRLVAGLSLAQLGRTDDALSRG